MILHNTSTLIKKMHISSLDINNFRGIKHLKIDDLKMINVFLGKNNVGKTSVLEAIFLSLAPGNPQQAIGIDNFRSLMHTNADDFRFIFYQLNYDNSIEINSTYRYDDLEKGLKINAIMPNTASVNTQNAIGETSSSFSSIDKGAANGLSLNYSYKKRHSKKESHLAKIEINSQGGYTQSAAKNVETTKGIYLSASALHANLSTRLEKVLINKQENTIIDFLKPADSTIQGLTLGTNNIILCDTGFGKRFPINLLGDGVIKLISILLAIYDCQGGILLIDEFSNGLHYTALKGLWRAIFKASKTNKVQIFLTTHDYEALIHLKNVLEEDEYQEYQSEIRSYTINKISDGNFKSYLYDFSKLELAINENNELR